MDYVFRRITEEDKQYLLKCKIWSPFGRISFSRYIVESLIDDVKMIQLGGQGIMKENGEEWSEMADYCAIIWKAKCYTLEFYYFEKWYKKTGNEKSYYAKYKIKSVYTNECDDAEKKNLWK